MAAETETKPGRTDESGCWCCGQSRPQDSLVRLGSHPEVGICVRCVRFLQRRAQDLEATVMRKRLRDVADSVRELVMARGWHRRPVIGPALRWLGEHLPW